MSDGYDPDFLGIPLPLPSPATATTRLDYPRFSVLLDEQRRFAAVTGVVIDGATLRDPPRTGEWRLDPRVPDEAQAGPEVYTRNDLDRGHLVRRRDPGWGSAAEAHDATEATFFYTNAAPQAAGFNQSKELWLGLEDHVLAYAETTDQRLAVFTAPVLGDDDPPYRGISVPLRFWKIAAWRRGEALAAAGFVLDQTSLVDTRQGLTVPPLGAFRTFQAPIADIADEARIDVGTLVAADTFVRRGLRPVAARELQNVDDIVL
ncbi:DNA/RNA non-specific endonuclease [Microbacterium trichothecenolyticum]|uniref:Endonuclease G n=1 Tax=Microbacterium trichothecenolyticum TaxID=69370 RepID=A0ABU0TUW6_MICTR|nr:DNA/RNA non-specific endonuclease [Microbacterium trichothecenolyticum]MDQ1122732.1 endonuclease G [Microbacterium trichothecenolyticum]